MRIKPSLRIFPFHSVIGITLIGAGVLWESLLGPSLFGWGAIMAGFLVEVIPRSKVRWRTPLEWPVLLLVLMAGVSLLITADDEATRLQVSRLGSGLAVTYGLIYWVRARRHLAIVSAVLIGGGVLLASVAPVVVDWSVAKGGVIPDAIYQVFPLLLADAVHPNTMATLLNLLMPLSLAFGCVYGLNRKPASWRIAGPALIAGGMMGIILLLTKSRAGYLAAGVAGLLTLWWCRQRILAFISAVVMAGAGVWLFTLAGSQTTNFAAGVDNPGSFLFRLEIWPIAVQMVRDFPFTGVGMGTFNDVALRLYPIPTGSIDNPGAHNLWLQVGVDLGVIGLIAFLSILLLTGFMGWRAMKTAVSGDDPLVQSVSIGALAGFVGYNIHGVTDIVVWGTRGAFMPWVIIGLITALYLQTLAKE